MLTLWDWLFRSAYFDVEDSFELGLRDQRRCWPPGHLDRRGGILHQGENTPAHVAPVGLNEEGLGVLAHRHSGLVLVHAAVASVGCVPNRVGPMRFAELRIVGGDEQIVIGARTEDHALIQRQHRIAQWSERSIEKLDVASHVLRWRID